MGIFNAIYLIIAAIVLIAFVSYLLWDHSKKTIDTRPEDIERLAIQNGWEFSTRSKGFSQFIAAHNLGYMGREAPILHVCSQKQGGHQAFIFDCFAATPISGVAIQFKNQQFLPLRVVERLIINRLSQLPADTSIAPDRLPQFVRAKVLVNTPAEHHDQICKLIDENSELQRLFKQRDLGYFCMSHDTAVFYFLTRYPADERGFTLARTRVENIIGIFDNEA
ncbi:MAG: hypothetical protein AB8G95_06660 [Anaerolineae bacterium]